jgi:hypothetical protein
MAWQKKKGLAPGRVVTVLKGWKRLGKIAKVVAASVVELIPPLSEPALDAADTHTSDESCRRLGHVAACPVKTKAACVVRTTYSAGSPTDGATLVGLQIVWHLHRLMK